MSTPKILQHQHRKKKFVYKERESPFPVPISSITRETASKNFWFQYTGQLQGDVILVTHSGDISYLNRMGFFGKGLMSRGEPSVYRELPRMHVPTDNSTEPDLIPVMRRRQYLKHMKWKKSHDKRLTNEKRASESSASEDEEFDSDIEYFHEGFPQDGNFQSVSVTHEDNDLNPDHQSYNNELKHTNQIGSKWSWNDELSNQNSQRKSCELSSTNQKSVAESWEMPGSNQMSGIDSWDTEEADENFWASDNTQTESSIPDKDKVCDLVKTKLTDDSITTVDSVTEKQKCDDSDDLLQSPLKRIKLCHKNNELGDKDRNRNLTERSSLFTSETEKNNTMSMQSGNSGEPNSENIINIDKGSDVKSDVKMNNLNEKIGKKITVEGACDKKTTYVEVDIDDQMENTVGNQKIKTDQTSEGEDNLGKGDEDRISKGLNHEDKDVFKQLPLHPYCINDIEDCNAIKDKVAPSIKLESVRTKDAVINSEIPCEDIVRISGADSKVLNTSESSAHVVHTLHDSGKGKDNDIESNEMDTKDMNDEVEYLVIDDSDIDDSTYPVQKKEKYTWLPVRKKEVFKINEPLVLSLEEAFFLSYGLGCLTVLDEDKKCLNLTDMWCRFCSKPEFLPRYVAYHYFRSKGWVIKPTILYGTDFLVYKVGPVFYHASYSMLVKMVYADTYEEVEGMNRKFSWTSFFGLNRITEHVAKTVVYCYVIMPRDLNAEERMSPDCIAKFKIRLQTVQRWVSSQDRDRTKTIEEIS